MVARVPRIGGTKNPDLDTIRTLEPDLVLANSDEQRTETLDDLANQPYDVLVTDTDSLAEVAETWTQLGLAIGAENAATQERQRLVDAIETARQAAATRPRLQTLIPVWKKPWMAAGGGTYLGDLLGACGFDNLLENVPAKWVRFETTLDSGTAARYKAKSGPLKTRDVHALPRTPDVVLLPTEPYAFGEDDRDDFDDLGTPRPRVRVVDGELLTWWLSKSVPALDHFARLHEELTQAEKKPASASAGSSTSTGRKSSGNARA